MDHEFITDGRRQQIPGGDALVRTWLVTDDVMPVVFSVIHESPGVLINPIIANNAMPGWIGSGG
jgi:hypothetical protein